MLHAVTYALRRIVQDDRTTLYLGPDRAGDMFLEVVVAIFSDDTETIIHAMPMRRGYNHLLKGLEEQ